MIEITLTELGKIALLKALEYTGDRPIPQIKNDSGNHRLVSIVPIAP